jgi:acyl-coenzyme A synthetase/AMP-(fatty) acid ligase
MTVPPELHAEVHARVGIPLMQIYGSIEAGVLAVNTITEGSRLAALGLPVEGKTIRIIGEHGEDASSGEIGELVVRGTGKYEFGLMSGYCDDTLSPWQDGWLHTGDLVYQDNDNYLYLVGRTYETINVAGHKIYAPEVERVLRAHPDVADAAVIGVPDVKRGEIVVAYVVPQTQTSITIKEIREHCSRYLAPHKLPKRILIEATLPRTATGKVNKQVLREQAE